MSEARLKNYRQSARKVRLVADTIRGKKVTDAITHLAFVPKRASLAVKKLVESALANAKHNHNMNEEDLFVKEIRVDEGFTMYRYRMRARGSVAPIRKRTSHISVVLGEKDGAKKSKSKKSDTKAKAPSKKRINTSDKSSHVEAPRKFAKPQTALKQAPISRVKNPSI